MKKVCVIGACGHIQQVLKTLRERPEFTVVGIAPGCGFEKIPSSFTSVIPFYEDYRRMLDRQIPMWFETLLAQKRKELQG